MGFSIGAGAARGLLRLLWACGTAAVTLLAAGPLRADDLRDAALAQREQAERLDQWRRDQERRAPLPGRAGEEAWREPVAGEHPCFAVQQVQLTVDDGAPASARALAGPVQRIGAFEGACLGVLGIEALRANLQARLRAQGFITSRLEVPPQDLGRGQLHYRLVPGLVEALLFEAGPGSTTPAASALAQHRGEILDLRALEQTLENLGRLPSQSARFLIEPGQAEGTSRVRIVPLGGERWRAGLGVENSDGRDYGPWQVSLQASLDAPLALSDQLGLSLAQARRDDGAGGRPTQTTAYVYWSVPLGRHALTLSLARAEFERFIAGGVGRFAESGRDDTARARWQWTAWRSGSARLQLWVAGSERRVRNYIDDIELVSRRRLATGVEQGLDWWRRGRTCQGGVQADGAQVQRMERDSEFQPPLAGLPRPWRAEVQGSCRLDARGAEFTGSLAVHRVAQPADGNDLVVLGSRYTVRGHAPAAALTGRGMTLARTELALAPWAPGPTSAMRLAFGLDWGRIHHPLDAGQRGRELAAAALTLRWRAARWSGELALTRALGMAADAPDKPRQRDRGWIGGLRYTL